MYLHDVFHGLLPADVVERCFSGQHFEGEYADGPNIHKVIVGFPLEYLWTDVVESSAVGGPSFFAVGRPSEIAQLADSLDKLMVTLESTMF
jgi:hypothetical protein